MSNQLEKVKELTGSNVLATGTATYFHAYVSSFVAAHKMAVEAVVQPTGNIVDAYVKSPGKTFAKHILLGPVGWIGTMTGLF